MDREGGSLTRFTHKRNLAIMFGDDIFHNKKSQARSIRLHAHHIVGTKKFGEHLLLLIFGDADTGISHIDTHIFLVRIRTRRDGYLTPFRSVADSIVDQILYRKAQLAAVKTYIR